MTLLVHLAALLMSAIVGPEAMRVRVVDADTSKPLDRVEVRFSDEGGQRSSATTDEKGEVLVALPPDSKLYRLRFDRDGYPRMEATWSLYERGTAHDAGHGRHNLQTSYEMRLTRGETRTGRIVDDLGKLVPNALVRMNATIRSAADQPPRESRPDWPSVFPAHADLELRTDDAGTWKTDRAAPEPYIITLTVEHPDYLIAQPRDDDSKDVIQLHRGVRPTVRVTENGKPVAGAKLSTVRNHYIVYDEVYHLVHTDELGHAKLEAIPAGSSQVFVIASGHAPAVVMFDARDDALVDVKLGPSRTIRGRVVDQDGKPLAKASIYTDGWHRDMSLRLTATTDADGRFELHDAPNETLEAQVHCDGYAGTTDAKLDPSKENEVKLMAAPVVRGTVTDARSGKPIERFRIVQGHKWWVGIPPQLDYSNEPSFASDGAFDRQLNWSTGTQALVVLRIEAEGHRPFTSEPFPATGLHDFNIKLEPAEPRIVRVRLPDGKPAAGAKVRLLLDGMQWNSWDDSYRADPSIHFKTDERGQLTLPAQSEHFWLFARADAGNALVEVDEHQSGGPIDIDLKPWARIEGTIGATTDGKPRNISISFNVDRRAPKFIDPLIVWRDDQQISADGSFGFNVPDLNGRPFSVGLDVSGGKQSPSSRGTFARFAPGEVTRIDLTGGTTIDGHVQLPEAATKSLSDHRALFLFAVPPGAAETAPANRDDAMLQAKTWHRTDIAPDGSYRFTGVDPGEYDVVARIYLDAGTSYVGSTRTRVTGEARGEPINAPSFTVAASRRGTIGSDAPAVLGRLFDDAPLKRETFKGKWIVAVVWDSCSGSMTPEAAAALDEVAKRFAADSSVALVSINIDRIACGMLGVPLRPGTLEHRAWQQAYVAQSDQSLFDSLAVGATPHVVIIDPAGKLAGTGVAPDRVAARLAELRRH